MSNRSAEIDSLIARLAKMPDDDVDAIMVHLDTRQRSRVAEQLARQSKERPSTPEKPGPALAIGPDTGSRLSAAIYERLNEACTLTPSEGMTSRARDALRRCAADMAFLVHPIEPAPSLVGRFWNRFGR